MKNLFITAALVSALASPSLAQEVTISAIGGVASGKFGSNEIGELKTKGAIGGAEIGARVGVGGLVFGGAIDALAGNVKGDYSDGFVTVSHKTTALYSARAIAGVPIGNLFIYGTGGVAAAQGKATIALPGMSFGASATHIGFVAGGGVEYAFDAHWSVKAEYRFYGFQKAKYEFDIGGAPMAVEFPGKQSIGLVGLLYRF